MDKDNIITTSHNITLNERKNLIITGVKKIDSFDDEEFLLETNMGYVVINGEELELGISSEALESKILSLIHN